jgi:hypothetical protein
LGKIKDIAHLRFGRLTVLEMSTKRIDGRAYWKCLCDCGNIKDISGKRLRSGETISCGCYRKENTRIVSGKNEIGNKYGKLNVIYECENGYNGALKWGCLCDCGNMVEVIGTNLRAGYSTSCGCSLSWHGDNNPNWKGGIVKFPAHFRTLIKQWKFDTLQKNNFKCVITGKKENLEVHHMYPFHKVFKQVFDDLQLYSKEAIGDYSTSELNRIEEYFLKIHNEKCIGVTLNAEIHKEFHSKYGILDFTPDDFREFFYFKTDNTIFS